MLLELRPGGSVELIGKSSLITCLLMKPDRLLLQIWLVWSRSAENLVLMGDQMQLGQPSQGIHPEDSGLSILDFLLHESPIIPDNMGCFSGHNLQNAFFCK